ncbi:ABC transporter ATP-binding protein [Streptomyces sp. NPDC017949]|uniref:ABC transporter ATP-binding protein n=1 Tax=Streptomyces sp. NPDC017949 TaxID=3365020 RepID=UPI0037B96186
MLTPDRPTAPAPAPAPTPALPSARSAEDPRPVVMAATGLVKEYRRGRAVDGVGFTIRAGERLGLLGPNGAGKTTTLLMCLGAVEPDAGRVEILGRNLHGNRARAMQGVGFVAGYLPLPDRVRVREYLRLYADLYGLRAPGAAVDRVLTRFGIEHLGVAIGTELSSGQRTLVGIAKAALHEPRLMILDEPTASLDPDIALRVRTALLALSAEQGTALLVTSHDMVEVERLCERVMFLHGGRIAADGTPAEVAHRFGRADLEGVFLYLAEERDRERATAR